MPGTGEELNHIINAIRRSKISFNFGQYYSIISARTLDIIIRHPSWHKTGELIGPLWLPASSMTVSGEFQGTARSLPWRQLGTLKSCALKISWNYGIMSAKINRKSTAPLVTFFYSTSVT